MPKLKNSYVCQQCGSQFPKWQGQCGDCGAWNSLVEERAPSKANASAQAGYAGLLSEVTPLQSVKMHQQARFGSGLAEFDHVLGGGVVADSAILLGGDPGIGKSTLLLQIITQIAKHFPALYVTGEESLQQVAMRAKRLGLSEEGVTLFAETQVERIIEVAQQCQPAVMVIDSIQTVFTEHVSSAPGGVGQVRESAAQLIRYAKQHHIALFIVGHVTKEGAIAGPRVLEHMVDAVLYFEGQSHGRYRVIRAVKNRFGAVNELGVFAMTDMGLREVSNPSAIFLSGHRKGVAGSSVMVTWEGSRPLLVEVQALVDESHLSQPRRVTVGLEHNRLAMLLAVLHRHGGIATYDQDVFLNVVGGLRVMETAADLPLIMAVLSSLKNRPLPNKMILFGEVGLSGEIRPVPNGPERLKEAAKHGFTSAIIPKANVPANTKLQIEIKAVDHLNDVLSII